MTLSAGTALGDAHRYQLVRPLGEGGMAVVWLARDTRTGRRVAVKVLRQGVTDEIRQRFVREARVMAQLHSAHVMPIHDVNVTGDLAWYVTDLARGGSLAGLISAHGALTPGQALPLVISILRGLEAVHAHRVVHRDVKPSNILFVDGVPRVADFGIAHVDDGGTGTQSTVGTPAYMAPEQLDGEPVGPPTDVYATGALLVHILTMGSPSRVRDAGALDALPDELRPVLGRACASGVADRYPSAAAFRAALEELLRTFPAEPLPLEDTGPAVLEAATEAATPRAPRRSIVAPTLAGVGAVFGVAVGAAWLSMRPAPGPDWADAVFELTPDPDTTSRFSSIGLAEGVLAVMDQADAAVYFLDPAGWLHSDRPWSERDVTATVRGTPGVGFGMQLEGDPRYDSVWLWSAVDGQARLFLGDGAPSTPTVHTHHPGVGGHGDWIDFDGDGIRDVLVSELGLEGVSIGYGPLGAEVHLDRQREEASVPALFVDVPNEGRTSYGPAIGDLNGDGLDDVVLDVRHPDEERWSVRLLFGGVRREGFLRAEDLPVVSRPASKPNVWVQTRVGDVDGDGAPDLVVASPSDAAAYVFWGPVGTEGRPRYTLLHLPAAQVGEALAVGDMDGDGRADLALGAPNSTDEVYLWRGRPQGDPFGQPDRVLAGLSGDRLGIALEMGDLDGDGRQELVVLADRKHRAGRGAAYLVRGVTRWETAE